jgi:signal transduction histidine kinase
MAELVRTTLDSYRYQIEQSGFTLEESIEDNLPRIRADREAIARSLLNLINNAVKYSSDDKCLAVKVWKKNGSVSMEVIDHGIGIPRCEQGKIFEKFYRVSDPLVHNTKGSGLGLSLVRHVVEAHGGRVWVESTPGKGSKFSIELPINLESKSAKAGATS